MTSDYPFTNIDLVCVGCDRKFDARFHIRGEHYCDPQRLDGSRLPAPARAAQKHMLPLVAVLSTRPDHANAIPYRDPDAIAVCSEECKSRAAGAVTKLIRKKPLGLTLYTFEPTTHTIDEMRDRPYDARAWAQFLQSRSIEVFELLDLFRLRIEHA